MNELQEKVKSLQAEMEAYRADAERYRWLRDESQNIPRPVPQVELPYSMYQDDGSCLLFGEELDEAIDAARATPNETKEAKS